MADELADPELAGYLEHHRSGYFRDLDLPGTARTRPVDYLLVWVLEGGLAGTVGDVGSRRRPGTWCCSRPECHSATARMAIRGSGCGCTTAGGRPRPCTGC